MPKWLDYLGLQFNTSKMQIQDAAARDPKKSVIKRVGAAFVQGSGGRTNFESPPDEVNFETITNAYKKDSYIRIAFDKYVEFMFKSGYNITGKNQKAVDYVKMRLALMAEATQTPINQLLQEIAEDIVMFGNCFIVKARASGSYQMPGIQATGIYNGNPVVGYFVMPVQTVKIARDKFGTILNYEQQAGSEKKAYKPEDMIHIYYKKERGYAFGNPFVLAVLDDVKLLRQIEDNVIRLIYRNLFPLYQYKVGLPEPGFEASDEEIEYLREQLRYMPLDGGLVVPERHDIKVIGAEGAALDIENYLSYFRQRVFTGLGIPPTVMGVADTSNRSTSDNLSTDFLDRIKAFQRIMADFIDDKIIGEILREGGFDPILKPEDNVDFTFNEIDLFSRNAMENQVTQLWTNNLIQFEEARTSLGKDPEVDESRLFLNMIKIPEIVATADAKAQAAPADGAVANKTQPANQYGKKPAAGRTKNSSEEFRLTEAKVNDVVNIPVDKYADMLNYHWDLTKEDVISLVKQYYLTRERKFTDFHAKEIQGIVYLTKESIKRVAEKYLRPAFIRGTDDARNELRVIGIPDVNYKKSQKLIADHNNQYLEKLMKDLEDLITKALRSSTQEDALAKVVGTFSALQYRLNFIATTESMYAYNYGFAATGKAAKQKEVYAVINEEQCVECDSRGKQVIQLDDNFESKIPPFHVNCVCTLTFIRPKEVV